MNIKLKIASVLLITLIAGVVLGALGNGALIKSKRAKGLPRLNADALIERIENILELDKEQKEEIKPLLKAHSAKFIDMNHRHIAEMSATMDTLLIDLSELLPEDQLDEYKQLITKRREMRSRGESKR